MNAQSKTIDSLNKILPALHDTAKIDCLNNLGKDYCNHLLKFPHYARTDSAALCVNEAYSEAVVLNYKLGIADAILNLAEINDMRYNFVIAQHYAEKAISLFKKIKNEPLLNQAYLTLSGILWMQGDISSEINNLELSLKYYKKVKNTSDESIALDWLSECYIWKGDFEKGYEYLQERINLTKNSSEPEDILDALNRKQALYYLAGWDDSAASYSPRIIAYKQKMGIDTEANNGKGFQYFMQHKWDSAQYYNLQMHNVIMSNNGYDSFVKTREILRNDIDIASLYQREGKYEKALPVFLQAIQYEKKRNCVWWELEALLNLSQIYQLKEKNNDAIYYAQNLLTLAQKKEANYYMLHASKLLWEIYDKKKDTAKAYQYYLKYTAIKDSTINGTYQRKLAVINELTHEREQQIQITALDKDNKLKQAIIQKNVLLRNILFASVFILILLSAFIYRIISLKRKNEKLENEKKQSELQSNASELEMQALRSQMNPHFIFNCLNSINRFIINNNAEKAANYLTKFAKLIRIVLEQSGKSFVPLEDEIACLKLYMDLEALRFEKPFQYKIDLNGTDVSSVMIPTLLLQPFVENAIWHGLHPKQNGIGKIDINMHQQNNTLHCTICDNGVGIRNSNKIIQPDKKSLGINITQQRLQLANVSNEKTKIEIQVLKTDAGENAGTCVDIKIPFKVL